MNFIIVLEVILKIINILNKVYYKKFFYWYEEYYFLNNYFIPLYDDFLPFNRNNYYTFNYNKIL